MQVFVSKLYLKLFSHFLDTIMHNEFDDSKANHILYIQELNTGKPTCQIWLSELNILCCSLPLFIFWHFTTGEVFNMSPYTPHLQTKKKSPLTTHMPRGVRNPGTIGNKMTFLDNLRSHLFSVYFFYRLPWQPVWSGSWRKSCSSSGHLWCCGCRQTHTSPMQSPANPTEKHTTY